MTGLPSIGLGCRDDGHSWGDPVREDKCAPEEKRRWPGVYWYRRYECSKGCAAVKIRRYDKGWHYMPDCSQIDYQDRDYLIPGGIDIEELCAYRGAQHEAQQEAAAAVATRRKRPRRTTAA
jgi:hypothetical protein